MSPLPNSNVGFNRTEAESLSYHSLTDGSIQKAGVARVFIHELIHAVLGYEDLVGIDGQPLELSNGDLDVAGFIANLADPNSDYLGQTVRLTNDIMSEVYSASPRGHYLNLKGEDKWVGKNIDSEIDQVIHGAQTATIDLVINRIGSTNVDGSASRDLIIGGAGNEQIFAGAGKDFIYGGGGDDVLSGGADTDFIHGGNGEDHCGSQICCRKPPPVINTHHLAGKSKIWLNLCQLFFMPKQFTHKSTSPNAGNS